MPANVLRDDPGTLGRTQIQNGAPVRGITWAAVARAINYANGSARTLIPHHSSWGVVDDESDTWGPVKFKVFPSYQATHRLWVATVEPVTQVDPPPTVIEFTDPSGGVATWRTSGTAGPAAPRTFEHVETVTSRTTAETELSVSVALTGDTDGWISLACFELPRPQLAIDANDLGLELGSFQGGHWIYDATGRSLGALPEALAGALSRGRRTLFQWAVPATNAGAFQTSSTSYVDVCGDFYPEVLERFLYSGETAPTCTARVLAWVSGGTGDVSITTGAGSVSTSVSATTPTWHTLSPAVNAEDMSTADGRRGGSADTVRVQARKNTSGTIYVASVGLFGRGS